MGRERELAEELERRRGEERFRSLVQASSDVIFVVGEDGAVRFQSPSAERVLGCAPDAHLGRPLVELMEGDGALAGGGLLALAGRGAFEWRARRADGSSVELEALVSDLRDDPRVGGLVITSRDVGERKTFERALAHRAFHDDLTGLPNRALLLERLRRGGDPVVVLRLDLDLFQMVRDSLGHAAGDDLLPGVAARLRGLVVPEDLVARLGNDEFAVLAHVEPAAAPALAERIVAALGRPFVLEGTEVRTGVNVGVAAGAAGAAEPEALLREADVALHAAKADGTARVAVFEPAMHTAALERLALRAALQRALEGDELVLHYQPVVELAGGSVVGVEALVRWRHPERGLVPPGAFVPLAEETGLVVPMGRWVLEEACRQVRAWQHAVPLPSPLRVSVNASPRQLLDPGFLDDVAGALERSGLDPADLVLEITETVLAHDTEQAIERLEALRALGVRVAIDDFGTGYSSLAYLQRLPLDELKVDRSFVEGIDRGDSEAAFAKVVLDLAHALGLDVVAEGIERAEQLIALRALGCGLGQGFLFARGLEPSALVALLEREAAEAAMTP